MPPPRPANAPASAAKSAPSDRPAASRDGGESCAPRGADEGQAGEELRCACGSLLARYVDGRVELKCRRCKRTMWITVSAEGDPES